MITYYASPDGSGNGLAPWAPASLLSAKTLSAAAAGTDDVTVYLRGGTYSLSDALVFGAADSGRNGHTVYWRAYQGEAPTLSGGYQVAGAWASYSGSIYRIAVAPGLVSRNLWVNGSRRSRARAPGAGLTRVNTVIDDPYNGEDVDGVWYPDSLEVFGGFSVSDATISGVSRPTELEVVYSSSPKPWIEPRFAVTSIAGGFCQIQGGGLEYYRTMWGAVADLSSVVHPSWVENALEFLVAYPVAGRWYLDSAGGWLYYIPLDGEELEEADVVLGVTDTLIESTTLDPAMNVQFHGLAFAHTNWDQSRSFAEIQSGLHVQSGASYAYQTDVLVAGMPAAAVHLRGAVNVVVSDCVVRNTGGAGIWLGPASSYSTITRSTFTDTGASAIRAGWIDWASVDPSESEKTHHLSITSNVIDRPSARYAGSAAIHIGLAEHSTISSNTIRDCPYTGISLGWRWTAAGHSHANEIAWNRIERCNRTLFDGGSIYTLGFQGDANVGRTAIHDNYLTSAEAAMYGDQGTTGVDWTANVCAEITYYFKGQGGLPSPNTATGNYASVGATKYSADDISWVETPTWLTGTDPAAWPAGAQAIIAASGPSDEASGQAAASGAITIRVPLAGGASGKSSGGANRVAAISTGPAAGQASGLATVSQQSPWDGSAAGQASAAGTLSQVAPSSGVERIFVLSSGAVEVEFATRVWQVTARYGSGVGIGIYPSGYYGPGIALAGAAAGAAGATATGSQESHLVGAAGGQSGAGASTAGVALRGTAGGRAAAATVPSQEQPLAGTAAGAAGATAVGPQTPVQLVGTAGGQAAGSGIQGEVPLAARGEGQATGSAALRVDLPLSGLSEGQAAAGLGSAIERVVELSARRVTVGLLATTHHISPRSARRVMVGLLARRR